MNEHTPQIADIPLLLGKAVSALRQVSEHQPINLKAINMLIQEAHGLLRAIQNGLLETDVLIHVAGGVVQDCFASNPAVLGKVILRDFDVEDSELETAMASELFDIAGDLAREVEMSVLPMASLQVPPFHAPMTPADIAQRVR